MIAMRPERPYKPALQAAPVRAAPGRTTAFAARLVILMLAGLAMAGCDTISDFFAPGGSTEKLPGERISVMALGSQLEADPRMEEVKIVLPEAFPNDAWPQPGGLPNNALHNLVASGELKELWSISAGDGSDGEARLTAPPIIADGRVYVLDAETTVRAFDAETGERLWKRDLTPEDEDAGEGRGGGVVYDAGQLFAVTGFGTVHELDPASGEIRWSGAVGQPVRAAPGADNGRLFIVTSDNQLVALDEKDGSVLWRHRGITESAGILAATSPAIAGATVIAPYSSGELYAIRVENGNPVWNDSLTRTGNMTSLTEMSDIAGRPVIDAGQVFAISHAGRMVAIDERTGERVWTRDIAGVQTPWVSGGFIFLVNLDGQLIAMSRRDGRIRWITQLQQYRNEERRLDPIQWSGPVLAGDKLLLVSSQGVLIMVSPYTGEVVDQRDLPDGAYIPPVVAKETVYILTDDAELTALR